MSLDRDVSITLDLANPTAPAACAGETMKVCCRNRGIPGSGVYLVSRRLDLGSVESWVPIAVLCGRCGFRARQQIERDDVTEWRVELIGNDVLKTAENL